MSLIAAFLWKKSPNQSISTLIFDDSNIKILSSPVIHYLPDGYLRFRRETNKIVKNFFLQALYFHNVTKQPIKIEHKIVFDADIPYLIPAKESKYVYRTFMYWAKKISKKIRYLKICPQLRKKLSGKSLKFFNRGLRSFDLLSRTAGTRYEYNLWALALHATPATFEEKLKYLKNKLIAEYWKKGP